MLKSGNDKKVLKKNVLKIKMLARKRQVAQVQEGNGIWYD
jgi:hypothetical protein